METNRVVLDSGAVTAIAARGGVARRYLENAIAAQASVLIPTAVLAECLTGTARDASIHRLLGAFDVSIVPLSKELAAEAGTICYQAGRPRKDTIDAIVVATADVAYGTVIMTSDPDDLVTLAGIRLRSRVVSIA